MVPLTQVAPDTALPVLQTPNGVAPPIPLSNPPFARIQERSRAMGGSYILFFTLFIYLSGLVLPLIPKHGANLVSLRTDYKQSVFCCQGTALKNLLQHRSCMEHSFCRFHDSYGLCKAPNNCFCVCSCRISLQARQELFFVKARAPGHCSRYQQDCSPEDARRPVPVSQCQYRTVRLHPRSEYQELIKHYTFPGGNEEYH
jgi:hypothetical protein